MNHHAVREHGINLIDVTSKKKVNISNYTCKWDSHRVVYITI